MNQRIGLGEYRVGRQEETAWLMHGLGSCIGLILADRFTRISAAAHVVLPHVLPTGNQAPARYGDRVVPFLLDEMRKFGAVRHGVFAQMVGGAQMFALTYTEDIGKRNIEVIRKSLAEEGIPLVASDVGGRQGRTLRWDCYTGCAIVTRVGAPDQIITPAAYRFAACSESPNSREVSDSGPRFDR